MSNICCIEESLAKYVGQTVTIFTTSGGLSGSGFTGVLAFVGNGCVKLITSIGAAPSCAVGSPCSGWHGGWGGHGHGNCGCREKKIEREPYRHGWNGGWGGWGNSWGHHACHEEREEEFECECDNHHGGNWLGSVTEIPINKIASFSHNAI